MHSLKVLEFDLVKEELAGLTESEPGRIVALETTPSWDKATVWKRLQAAKDVGSIFEHSPPSLRGLSNVSNDAVAAHKGRDLDGATLWKIGQSLICLSRLKEFLQEGIDETSSVYGLFGQLPDLADLGWRLDASLDGDGYVHDAASPELGRIRAVVSQLGKRALDLIQNYTTGRHRDLLSDPLYTQRNGRYVIPLKAENRGKIRGIVHDSSASGQTIYVEPDDVVSVGNKLRESMGLEKAEVNRILKELSELVGREHEAIEKGIEAGAQFDLMFAACRLKDLWNGTWAEEAEADAFLRIEGGRHPLLDPTTAVPLDLMLGGETTGLLITGPNTGGKTVAIKTVGLAVLLSQSGLPVPARFVTLGAFSQVWADIGDEQSLQQSLSTFSGHIKNISSALRELKPGSLVLMDEVGAGTDPAEGAALAKALLEDFVRRGALVMASTHYGELKLFASDHPQFMNASMEFDLKSLKPTYRFLMGTPGSSHAFNIAKRYGIPDHVIKKAEEGFSDQDKDVSRMIEELEAAQKRARVAQSEADRLSAKLKRLEAETGEKLADAERARTKIRTRMADELEELLRQVRVEAAEVFEAVKRDPTQKGLDAARKRLKELQDVGKEFTKEIRPTETVVTKESGFEIVKGAPVKILGLNLNGTVLHDPKGNKVAVQAGALRMDVELSKIIATGRPAASPQRKKVRVANLAADKAMTAQREVHLRHFRAEDALEELEKFVDESLLAGIQSVRIVHGKGEGVLRNVTREFLRTHSSVVSFADATAEEGGHGVTIAVLK